MNGQTVVQVPAPAGRHLDRRVLHARAARVGDRGGKRLRSSAKRASGVGLRRGRRGVVHHHGRRLEPDVALVVDGSNRVSGRALSGPGRDDQLGARVVVGRRADGVGPRGHRDGRRPGGEAGNVRSHRGHAARGVGDLRVDTVGAGRPHLAVGAARCRATVFATVVRATVGGTQSGRGGDVRVRRLAGAAEPGAGEDEPRRRDARTLPPPQQRERRGCLIRPLLTSSPRATSSLRRGLLARFLPQPGQHGERDQQGRHADHDEPVTRLAQERERVAGVGNVERLPRRLGTEPEPPRVPAGVVVPLRLEADPPLRVTPDPDDPVRDVARRRSGVGRVVGDDVADLQRGRRNNLDPTRSSPCRSFRSSSSPVMT